MIMMRLRFSRSAIAPDTGATSADGTWVNRKLADSHTVDPVLAYTAKDSAIVAAQLPVFDAADAIASRHTSPRSRVIIKYAPVQRRCRNLSRTPGIPPLPTHKHSPRSGTCAKRSWPWGQGLGG